MAMYQSDACLAAFMLGVSCFSGKPESISSVQEHAVQLVKEALDIAGVKPADIACIAYTKVPPPCGQSPHLTASQAAALQDSIKLYLKSSLSVFPDEPSKAPARAEIHRSEVLFSPA